MIFREHVLNVLPSLTILDGLSVTRGEYEAAARCVKQTDAMVAIMFQNACSAHKMVRCCLVPAEIAFHQKLAKK
jgi:hypothetical protein